MKVLVLGLELRQVLASYGLESLINSHIAGILLRYCSDMARYLLRNDGQILPCMLADTASGPEEDGYARIISPLEDR